MVGFIVFFLCGFGPTSESGTRRLGLEYGKLHVGTQLSDKGVKGQSTATAYKLHCKSKWNAHNNHPRGPHQARIVSKSEQGPEEECKFKGILKEDEVDNEKQQSRRTEPKQVVSRCHGRHFLHVLSFAQSDVFAMWVEIHIGSHFTSQACDDHLKLFSNKEHQDCRHKGQPEVAVPPSDINKEVDANKCPQVTADAHHMLEVFFHGPLDVAVEVKAWFEFMMLNETQAETQVIGFVDRLSKRSEKAVQVAMKEKPSSRGLQATAT